MKQEEMIRNLEEAGCHSSQINQLMKCIEDKDDQRLFRLLKCHRFSLLDDMHDIQKKIDCLDYFIFILKKKECESHEKI